MTFEQRMAELGVDPGIVSLHEDRCDALYERFFKASEATAQELGIGFSALTLITVLLREIAERDEIIDHMETRIVNLTGERDYLIDRYVGCEDCIYGADATFCEEPCVSCENMEHFEWIVPEWIVPEWIVPEDWRADDDQ